MNEDVGLKENNAHMAVFRNEEFGEVRTVEDNGIVWFCGADVCKALGYLNARDALQKHCKEKGVANATPLQKAVISY